MSAPRIDTSKLRKLQDAAEKLGYRVIHIHADIKVYGQPCCVKLTMHDKGKK